MLKACIGYGIGINWDADAFPQGLFDDLGEKTQREFLEDHLDYSESAPLHLSETQMQERFDFCALYACLSARVISDFPLLEAYTPGIYSDEENPFVVVYIKTARREVHSGHTGDIHPIQGTEEENRQMDSFCKKYFAEKKPGQIFWAELS